VFTYNLELSGGNSTFPAEDDGGGDEGQPPCVFFFKNKTKHQKPYLVFLFNLEVTGRFEISSKRICIFIMSLEHCRRTYQLSLKALFVRLTGHWLR